MAIDTEAFCDAAHSDPQSFFVIMCFVFAAYILIDTLIACVLLNSTINARDNSKTHRSSEETKSFPIAFASLKGI